MPPIGLFSALADETRCTIITMLHQGPLPVHKLADAFDISRPAISRHLRVLGEAGLVRERKKGRENIYELKSAPLTKGQKWIAEFLPKVATKAEPADVEVAPEPAGVLATPSLPAPAIEIAPETVAVAEAPAAAKKPRLAKPKPARIAPAEEQMQMFFDL